jgi:hypothetical protein
MIKISFNENEKIYQIKNKEGKIVNSGKFTDFDGSPQGLKKLFDILEIKCSIDDELPNRKDDLDSKIDKILYDMDNFNIELEEAKELLMDLIVNKPSRDKAVNIGFDIAKSGEYNRRCSLKDTDDDLYYSGWMDCFDWLFGKK